jgi:localization factor PodJL
LGRKKSNDTDADAPELEAAPAALPEAEPEPRRNGDRAALETLRSTPSARPLTIALGAAILLAVAALVYLVKDFVFKPDSNEQQTAPTIQTPASSEAASGETESALAVVPEAPSIDPQALYTNSIAALSAAGDETAALAAVEQLQDAAALGYPPAQLQLGELYKTGQGVEQDLGQARVWFRRAANGGNVLAMHRIGVMTARGDGGPADAREAIAWFEQAANFGLVDSHYNLGAIYHPSEGGASSVQNASDAYYWYSLAARNGDDQAQPLAAGVAAALSPQERATVDARVAAWRAEAADEAANLNANTN